MAYPPLYAESYPHTLYSSAGNHSPTYSSSGYGSPAMTHSVSHSSHSSSSSPSCTQPTYGSSPPMSSQNSWYAHNAAQLADIDFTITEPLSNQKKGRSKSRSGSSSNDGGGGGQIYHCLSTNCTFTTTRMYDLKRHQNGHFKTDLYPCPYHWCERDKTRPFTRRDHLDVHLRTVHMKDIPKKGRGGKKREQKKGEVDD